MDTPDDEARIAAIVAQGRGTRAPIPRALWITAIVIGAVCAVAFIVMLAIDSPPAGPPARPADKSSDAGTATRFGAGLAIGVGIGIVIGFLIGRRHSASHAERDRP